MRSALLALVLFAGCSDAAEAGYPVLPGSTNVPAVGVGTGGFGSGGGDDMDLDAGTGSGSDDGDGGVLNDAGVGVNDAGPFLDAAPADAAALLPDAQTDFPPFP
jgi:hypothetical protein